MTFCVVEFLDTNELAVVPPLWMQENDSMCIWPPYKQPIKINKAVINCESPGCGWKEFKIRYRYKAGIIIHTLCTS